MKILNTLAFYALFVIFVCACKKQSPEFIRLDKLTMFYNQGNYLTQREVVLISNPPKNNQVLDSLMIDYVRNKSILLNIDSVNSTKEFIKDCTIKFYKKTHSSSYYLTHEEDKYHEIYYSSTWGKPDKLGWFWYERKSPDSKEWISTYPENLNDTIYSK